MDLSQFLQPGACDLPSVHQMTFLLKIEFALRFSTGTAIVPRGTLEGEFWP